MIYLFCSEKVNTLANDKILDQTKLKVFADDKSNVTKMIISVFDRVENIVGKGKNCSYKLKEFADDIQL